VTFADWRDERALQTLSLHGAADPAPYEPGEFYRRELPYLLQVLARIDHPDELGIVIVDGFVWLGPERPGLGARLHEALEGRVAVVGVAKTGFHGAPAQEVQRGASKKPLFVTAVGLEPQLAAAGVLSMHGEHRIPTLLKQVDRIARGLERAAGAGA
jgi:deoxyribonuclease V